MDSKVNWFPTGANASQWLDHMRKSGQLESSEQQAVIAREIRAETEKVLVEVPLYLRALSGIGAIISGSLLLYLLYLFGLFDEHWLSMSINGLVLMGVAALLHRSGTKARGLREDFLMQIALTLLQAGKVCLVFGLAHFAHNSLGLDWAWPVALILCAIAVISFLLFPSSLERFVAAFSALVAIWISMLVDGPERWQGAVFALLIACHLILVASFLRWSLWRSALTSLYDAILVSLCLGIGIIASFVNLASVGEVSQVIKDTSLGLSGFAQKWPTQIVMTLGLLGLVLWIAGRNRSEMGEAIWLSLAGILLLGLVSDPGILLALGLLLLGYATHRPPHILLGLFFAILFGFQFYYALDLTLLQKSASLIVSGLLLLGAASFIHWRGWYKPGLDRGAETGRKEPHRAESRNDA